LFSAAGLRPESQWGAYSAPPDPLDGLRGPTSKGEGVEKEGKEEKKGRGRERVGPPPLSQIPGSTYPELKKAHTCTWQKN